MSCITTKFIITLYCFKHIFLCGTTDFVFCVLTARKLEDYCLVSNVHVSQETGNGPDHCCTLVMCPVLYYPAAGPGVVLLAGYGWWLNSLVLCVVLGCWVRSVWCYHSHYFTQSTPFTPTLQLTFQPNPPWTTSCKSFAPYHVIIW